MATFVRVQEVEHEIGERGHLGLRVTSPDVEMRAVDGGIARIRVTFEIRASSDRQADEIFERVRFQVAASAGSLEVVEPKDGPGGIGALVRLLAAGERADARVDVDAPRYADVRFEGVSADLVAAGLRGSQEYRTVSGDVVIDRVGGDLRIKGVSSDISLRADFDLPALEINTVSGDISAVAPRIGQLRLVTVSGDIELEGSLADGPQHRIETVSGDLALGVDAGLTMEVRGLSTDVEVRMAHRSEGSRDRRRYVIGEGGPSLLFSSMSGDVEVRPPRRGGGASRDAVIREAAQLDVLRALERGEIDVDEAARRLGVESAPGG